MVSEGETKIQGNSIYIEDGATAGRRTMDPVVLSCGHQGLSGNGRFRKSAVKKALECPDVQLRKPPTFLEEVLQLVLERLQILLW